MMKNKQQFVEAYKKHFDALLRFCFFKISDRELAKDLIQDTFVKAWRYISTHGKKILNIRAFLYKILSNLIIDEYRKRKFTDSLEVMQENGFDPGFDDTKQWGERIDGIQAMGLIQQIPGPYADVLFMRYVDDLSLSEIASLTGERENAIAVRLHRGMSKLKTLFKEKNL